MSFRNESANENPEPYADTARGICRNCGEPLIHIGTHWVHVEGRRWGCKATFAEPVTPAHIDGGDDGDRRVAEPLLTDEERETVQSCIRGIERGIWHPTPAMQTFVARMFQRLLWAASGTPVVGDLNDGDR